MNLKPLRTKLTSLRESLATRKLLDRAKGILMTAHGFTEQEAYRSMQQYSMNRRLSIKEVAEAIIKDMCPRTFGPVAGQK
jgi:AmiR/NasT family two-component response regulator